MLNSAVILIEQSFHICSKISGLLMQPLRLDEIFCSKIQATVNQRVTVRSGQRNSVQSSVAT